MYELKCWWKKLNFAVENFQKFIKSIRKNKMISKFFFIQIKWYWNIFSFEWNDVERFFYFIWMKWKHSHSIFISNETEVFSITFDSIRPIPRRTCICEHWQKKSWNSEHTSTFDTINNLKNLYSNQNKMKKIENMYLRTLIKYEKILNFDHKKSFDTRYNLAIMYKKIVV